MMACALDWNGTIYFRFNRDEALLVYPEIEPYHIGKMTLLREGSDAVVFACGQS